MSTMDIYFSLHFYHFSMAPPRTASKRGKLPAPRLPVTRQMGARTPQRGVSGSVATRSETGQSTSALDGGEHDIISCDNSTMQAQGDHAIPDSFPIDERVTDSLKQKIWSNEFIHLSQLLKANSEPEHFNITMLIWVWRAFLVSPSKETTRHFVNRSVEHRFSRYSCLST